MTLFTDGYLQSFERMMQDTGEHPWNYDEKDFEPRRREESSGKCLTRNHRSKEGEEYGSHKS